MAALNPYQVTRPRLPTTDPFAAQQKGGSQARSANPFNQTAAMMGAGSGSMQTPPPPSQSILDQWTNPGYTTPGTGQPLQAPTGGNAVNPDFINALMQGGGNLFGGIGNWASGIGNAWNNAPGVAKGALSSALGPAVTAVGGIPGVGQGIAAAQGIGSAAGGLNNMPNPLNGGKPMGGPSNSTLNPQGNGQSGATQTPQSFPNSSLSLDPSAMGKGSYFNPDSGDTSAGFNSLLLQGGLNPMTSAVGRFASGQAGRMNDQYMAGLAGGGITPGMSMEDYQRQFINSGGVGTSSDLRPILQRGMALAQSGAIPGQTPGLSAQDNAALTLYAEIEANPGKLGQMYTHNLGYALPHSDSLANYINQATRLNQSRNPGQLTDFVQAYLNGSQ